MSLLGFQTAVAALIRLPERRRRTDLSTFLSQFSLDDQERRQLFELSKIEQVDLFGMEQAEGRFEMITRHARRVFLFVDPRTLKSIWSKHYEASALFQETDIEGRRAFTLGFLRFLLDDQVARSILEQRAPRYIFDLISFEIAELELMCPRSIDLLLNDNAVIRHAPFRILTLGFDIPALLAASEFKSKTVRMSTRVTERETLILAVRMGSNKVPRVFEIDRPMHELLLSQLVGAKPKRATRQQLADLESIGL